jgi:replicative DNA helicase
VAVAETSMLAPPHSLDAEQAVLGGILLAEKRIYGVVIDEGLRSTDFYRPQHGAVFDAMLALYDKGEPIDDLTLKEHLKARGKLEEAGGEALVDELASAAPVAANVRQYASIVREHALERRLQTTCWEILGRIANREAPPRELVDQAERAMLEVGRDDKQKDFVGIEQLLHDALDRFHALSQQKTTLTGTPSGFRHLDEMTGGFQPGNLIVLAARPGMGKSALVTNMAENAAIEHGKPVALFSLEMSEAELAQRFVASQASIKGDELRRGRVEDRRWPRVLDACQKLGGAPLYVDDSSDVGTTEVRAKARRLHQQSADGLGLVIVDYLQLMRADGRIENRVQQVGEMSRGLKLLAKELDVPVIALSQLSRGVEQRHDKRPLLSDLRESGNVEQDADLVMFIYRDEYYEKDESEEPGIAEVILSKHRNGALGTVKLVFQAEYPRFRTHIEEDRFA